VQAVYYRDHDGVEPVREFLSALPVVARAALDLQIDRLNMLSDSDPPLPYPHSSQVVGDLRELRCHFGRSLYRVLYRRSASLFILLHIFEKTSSRIPSHEIAVAEERWEDFQTRMNSPIRRPPRPVGHDAP
jgi:phage-related protein